MVSLSRLSNGLTVIVHHMPIDVAAIYVFYNVGAKNEYPGIFGGSHLVEHMLFRKIEGLRGSVDELVEGVGGYFNGFTNYDYTVYVEVLPAEYAELGFEIESKRMTNAVFDPSEFELERKIVLSEFDMNENDPDFRLVYRASMIAWDVHPYRYAVAGLRSDLNRVSRDELFRYYRRYYNPGNAVLVVVGGLGEDKAVELANKYFGSIEPGGESGVIKPWDDGLQGRVRVELKALSGETPRLLIAFKVPGAHDIDGLRKTILADFIISGDRAFTYGLTSREPMVVPRSSRLYRLVEEGLGDAVYSYYEVTYMNNLYSIIIYNVKDPDRAIMRVEELIAERPSEDELGFARERIMARLVFSTDSPSKLAQIYGLSQLFMGDPGRLISVIEDATKSDTSEYIDFVNNLLNRSISILYR
ncbi:peptidase M16 domain protein [Vulcanisaeta moutnovskia 768-28]|uniref:Peptidase M16 domain protein n=1 Tax=Vulcanisaeta moutnovskia (strain 768-28) TaxID=985053 RepID=F0QTP0_VULM7|nr:pitrilysin family protein [Vulcanisaeta moutnovskia]ADY01753.1 peptidase M16 domain protein [Vulcanisaeta moutnovskia 768-28]